MKFVFIFITLLPPILHQNNHFIPTIDSSQLRQEKISRLIKKISKERFSSSNIKKYSSILKKTTAIQTPNVILTQILAKHD
jgi:histone H3/H4